MVAATIMEQGQNLVMSPNLYGGTHTQFNLTLPKLGLHAKFAPSEKAEDMEPLIDENTRGLYVETFGNPSFTIPNFEEISALAKRHQIPLIVDNTFGACGAYCQPIKHGADIVVQSATKWLGGHGTTIGGMIVDVCIRSACDTVCTPSVAMGVVGCCWCSVCVAQPLCVWSLVRVLSGHFVHRRTLTTMMALPHRCARARNMC